MEKGQEKYQPTRDEIKKAQEMMTNEQKNLSLARESIIRETQREAEIMALADQMSSKERERHLKKFEQAVESVAKAVLMLRHLDNEDIAAAHGHSWHSLKNSITSLIYAVRKVDFVDADFEADIEVAMGRAEYDEKGLLVEVERFNPKKYGL